MQHGLSAARLAVIVGLALLSCLPAAAQQRGGTLTIEHIDSPPSASIHEEGTASVVIPFMAIYNNLVIYNQHVAQNSREAIVPDLASAWQWDESGTALTFTLREGVKWHDGTPFTAADVKCTWDMVAGLGETKLRRSPRQAWYRNLESVTVSDAHRVTFHLKRKQPALLALLASGWSPVYPCRVPPATMRTQPVGTGPFRFVNYRQNQSIRLERNPDYWKPGLPYLDAIEYKIIPSRATRMLAFIAGRFDMTYPPDVSVPLLKEIRAQAPQAQCLMRPTAVSTNVIINRDAAPFDESDIRRALALTLDRSAFVDILSEGQAKIGGAMLPPPEGLWGLPPEELSDLPGYGPDVAASREQARALMQKHGYGPNNRLRIKLFTRNLASFRDPALILIDQLKHIYIDAELDVVDTALFYNRVFKKDYTIGMNQTGSSVDDPDQHFFENYACGSLRNYTNYCNPGLEKLFVQQSTEADFAKRRAIVWEIERTLAEDIARPVLFHGDAAACWQPAVKNLTIMVNSIYNGWRFEDVWLEQ